MVFSQWYFQECVLHSFIFWNSSLLKYGMSVIFVSCKGVLALLCLCKLMPERRRSHTFSCCYSAVLLWWSPEISHWKWQPHPPFRGRPIHIVVQSDQGIVWQKSNQTKPRFLLAALAEGRDFSWQWHSHVQREAGTCWPCWGLGKPCAVGHGCCPWEMKDTPLKGSF